MKRIVIQMALIFLTLWLTACDSAPSAIDLKMLNADSNGRGRVSLNEGWAFRRGEGLTQSESSTLASIADLDDSWNSLTLPHTWNVEDGADGGDNYFRGDGWYHRNLSIDEDLAGRRFYLHFNGANLVADVYLDGEHIGRHEGGYAAFRFDISEALTPGKSHLLSVKVNNERDDDIPPLAADFTFYGGLYRGVELIVTEPLHIEMMDYASPGVFITQQNVSAEQATLAIRTTLVNDSDREQQAQVVFELRDAQGKPVAQQAQPISVAAQQSSSVSSVVTIDKPHLWQGVKDPYLYTMAIRVETDGMLRDALQQPVGLRSFSISPEGGALLNGQVTRMNGVSRHQDRAGKGWALSDEDHSQDFQLITDMGANAVRLAHYQHAERVYQLTDELGLLVWAEVPVITEVTDSEGFTQSAKQQLKELIRQNYNHPSIVMWGLFNEISIRGSSGNAPLVEKLQALAKQEDPARLTTGAVLGDHESEKVWMLPDVIAQNRYDGWYYNDFDGMDAWLHKVRKAYPERAVGISEYGAGASADIHKVKPVNQDHSEEYQNLYHEANWLIMREHPAMWGSFIWNMFDFAADLRDEGATAGINDKGLVSFDREVKKDAYFWYQSHWRETPMIYITSRRFTLRKTPTVDIKVYSNLDEVELSVGGKALPKLKNDGSNRFQWTGVEMVMGDNPVVARSTGKESLSDKVVWQRVLNDDTRLSSPALGIDTVQHRIFNLPYEVSREELEAMLVLPYGARMEWPTGSSGSDTVSDDWQLKVIAANGDTQSYGVSGGALSLGRPVKASRELSHGMMGSPPAVAKNVVDGNARLDGESGEDAFWITADPNQGPGWLKIDLGANYYLDSLEAAWLPAHINDKGTIKYSIDIAEDVSTSAVVFSETYREVVDGRNNSRPLQTRDTIASVARYVRVNIWDSSYTYKVPILGRFKLIGATEFSVFGGLIYSSSLAIDYKQREIELPNETVTVANLLTQLQVVGEDPEFELWSSGSRLPDDSGIEVGDYLVVAIAGDGQKRRERYDFVAPSGE